jgi:Flp pilus assembly CpaF family ATPase
MIGIDSINKKPNKYKAIKTEVDNVLFASKKEAARYCELRALLKAGKIKNLVLQPEFKVVVEGKKICTYKADFSYLDEHGFKRTIEDVKGMKTPVYRLKKKLVEAIYNIEIIEK